MQYAIVSSDTGYYTGCGKLSCCFEEGDQWWTNELDSQIREIFPQNGQGEE